VSRPLRLATFNVALARERTGAVACEMITSRQALAVAEVIARVRPDVLLINELDHDPGALALRRFVDGPLRRAAPALFYPHCFTAPVNTGEPSGLDLDGDGRIGGPGDAYGFGTHPGQYGMALLSRFPIDRTGVRTFRRFLWRDLPGADWPRRPLTGAPWYDERMRRRLRLSSKSHWDIPIRVGGGYLQLLISHPTPPAFDGPERRNVHRNREELRFWLRYLDGDSGLCDDQGRRGGAGPEPVVLLGDLNADPAAGNGDGITIRTLLAHPRLQDPAPVSRGAAAAGTGENPAVHTAAFGRLRLRLDYVLPDRRLQVLDSGVYWPTPGEDGAELVGDGSELISSDHRLVWVDVALPRTGRR
jgi:hypothetical protein